MLIQNMVSIFFLPHGSGVTGGLGRGRKGPTMFATMFATPDNTCIYLDVLVKHLRNWKNLKKASGVVMMDINNNKLALFYSILILQHQNYALEISPTSNFHFQILRLLLPTIEILFVCKTCLLFSYLLDSFGLSSPLPIEAFCVQFAQLYCFWLQGQSRVIMSHHAKNQYQWRTELRKFAMHKFTFRKPPNKKQQPKIYADYKKIINCSLFQRTKIGQSGSVAIFFGREKCDCTCGYVHSSDSKKKKI